MTSSYAAPVNDEQRQQATDLQLAVFAAEDALTAALVARNEYLRGLYKSGIGPTEIGTAVPRRESGHLGRTEVSRIVRGAVEGKHPGIKRPRVR